MSISRACCSVAIEPETDQPANGQGRRNIVVAEVAGDPAVYGKDAAGDPGRVQRGGAQARNRMPFSEPEQLPVHRIAWLIIDENRRDAVNRDSPGNPETEWQPQFRQLRSGIVLRHGKVWRPRDRATRRVDRSCHQLPGGGVDEVADASVSP